MASIAPADLRRRMARRDAPVVLDVRTRPEFEAGHVEGAINIPFTEIGTRAGEIPSRGRDELVIYCGHGPRAWIAAARLRQLGFRQVVYLRGHWARWKRSQKPEVRSQR
jgi:rhodanese-related sulfurtransferase